MDEKMKTTLLAVLCFLIIVSSFIGMQYLKSLYVQETIELSEVSFKVPNGFSYVNGSYEKVIDESENGTTFYKILLRNQDETIELRQYNTTLELNSSDVIDVNGISVYKNGTDASNQHFAFNFNGKGYQIIIPIDSSQLIEDIVSSMEAKE
ncbi:MAG: hypothetical protein FWH54_06225 [Methanobrevibacter sp.]|nr:hypothetical protein [Methanobrevibacter sp.]